MTRKIVFAAVFAGCLTGCSSFCSRKQPTQACCPPTVVPAPIIGTVPATTARPEVIFPSAPPTSVPLAPAPSFPAAPPRTSGFAPVVTPPPTTIVSPPPTSFASPPPATFSPPPPASQIANVPVSGVGVDLEKPEFSETGRPNATSLKAIATSAEPKALPVSIRQNARQIVDVVPGKISTGPRPTLDDLDRLQTKGVKQIVCLKSDNTTISAVDRLVYQSRAMGFSEVAFNSTQLPRESTYVFSDDASALKQWWKQYFKTRDVVSEDAAELMANRLVR